MSHLDESPGTAGGAGNTPDSGGTPNHGRRRLLQGGLAGAPVLMTLVSKPVLGQQVCLSPSAYGSGNVSQPGAGAQPCPGRTPGYWKQKQWFDSWKKTPFYPETKDGHTATLFHSIATGFNHGPPARDFGDQTMLDVLTPQGGDSQPPGDVGRHVVAALLNVAAGFTTVPSMQVVRDIWNEYAANDCYEPTAGVKWYHDQIVTYLKSTMA